MQHPMLHFNYLKTGSRLDLPEVAGHLQIADPSFEILAVHFGGMGACIRLKSISSEKTYALKCIRPDLLDDGDFIDRFHDELDVWLSASTCNAVSEAIAVVRINDVPAVLATWMDGGDLASAMPSLAPQQKFETIIRVLRALQWVQTSLGVIHRDLKPENILLDKDSVAYVSDWGLARPLRNTMRMAVGTEGPTIVERPDRTQTGTFLGSVMYAAPEQIRSATNVDHRADIYALGCIMFELETGSPPFGGSSFQEIANKHLYGTPPKLSGLFQKTSLGLELVIRRCLAKDPAERYPAYKDLEHDLLAIASKRHFSLDRCEISERYKRHPLGKGYVAQVQVHGTSSNNVQPFTVIEHDAIVPFLAEANNLMALGRYKEAEVLLWPYYIPEVLARGSTWHLGHTFAETYALCLQHISDRLNDSLEIYTSLSYLQDKPAEFYVNYSLALLRASKWADARIICERGINHFPADLDILGNYTISLKNVGDIEAALQAATRRLSMRRDVHSIEEAVNVFGMQRDSVRNHDLPEAIRLAKIQSSLIKEGLFLNPRYPSLRITEIQFYQFVNSQEKALSACQALMDDLQISASYKQLAFAEMVKILGEGLHFKVAIDLIDKSLDAISSQSARKRVILTKWKIYADKYMIGKDNASGERIVIKEVVDFFLAKEEGAYVYPIMAARVLEWLGHGKDAEMLLRGAIHLPGDSWNARKELAFVLQRDGRPTEAISMASELVDVAPWRAESYDVLSSVAARAKNVSLAKEAKGRGDQIFEKEMALFDDLKAFVDHPPE